MISIIVPVYKTEKYLQRCIESIVNQTYKDWELILVDDGSPDNCPQICDQWAQIDNRIKVIHNPNGGLSAARNTGLEMSTGEYYCFVDSDDYIAPDLCTKVMHCFERTDADIITFDSYMVNEQGEILGSTENIQDGELSRKEALVLLMKGDINHYAWNKMYKRQVFQGVRFPLGRLWEDVAISYKLLLNSNRIYCCSEKLYYYVQRADSIVHQLSEKALQDIFLSRHEVYNAIKTDYPEAAEIAFDFVVMSARSLYDRSLWADVDERTLKESCSFLQENKMKIMSRRRDCKATLLLLSPSIYRVLRTAKHVCGEIIRKWKS